MNNNCMPGTEKWCEKNRPLAQAFVINQGFGEDMFCPMEALKKGTVYPALYMPYTFWRFKNEK